MSEKLKVWAFFAAIAALGIVDGFAEYLWPDAYYRFHHYAFDVVWLLCAGYWVAVLMVGLFDRSR
jgi:hypothetical protein